MKEYQVVKNLGIGTAIKKESIETAEDGKTTRKVEVRVGTFNKAVGVYTGEQADKIWELLSTELGMVFANFTKMVQINITENRKNK